MNQNIKIDFHGGTHGHFLEYVVNTYIYKCPPSKNIYSDRGSVEEIDMPGRRVVCGHFSKNAQGRNENPKYDNFEFADTDRIIKIDIDQYNDQEFFIAFTNLLNRSSGATLEEHMENIPKEVRKNKKTLRNDFYSKINERTEYANLFPPIVYPWRDHFVFQITSFYNYVEFVESLYQLANWLGESFTPDKSLYTLWDEFDKKNQGLNSYNKCNEILLGILGNQDITVECTVLEEAWILYNIKKITGIYLDIDKFPTSTKRIYKLLFK